MDCRTWLVALAAFVAPAGWTTTGHAAFPCVQKSCPCQSGCVTDPCQASPYYSAPEQSRPPGPPMAADDPMAVPPMDQDLTQPEGQLPALPSPANSFASASQLASASEAIGFRDATIGDFFGSSSRISGPSYEISDPANGFNVPVNGGDRRFKLTENISPIPVDRWFVNYNHYSQPLRDITQDALDVDRVTFGLEKTFFNEAASLEVRMPLSGGLDRSQQLQDESDQGGFVFGNMTFTLKGILWQWGSSSAVTAGLGINVPTAEDGVARDGEETLVYVENQSVHLLPFIAWYHRHTPRTWSIAIAQLDFDANGNEYVYDGGSSVYQEQTLLFLDYSAGHWFYEDACGCRLIRRAAVVGELHYTTTLNDTDRAQAGPTSNDIITNPFNRIDVLNGTAGLRFQLGENYLLTTAAVFPLLDGESALFDSEIAILLTRRF